MRRTLANIRFHSTVLAAAKLSSFLAVVILASVAVDQGPPVSPDGTGLERDLLYVFAGTGFLAAALAWWRPLTGGWLLVVIGVALGIGTAIRYTEETSLLAALLYVIPGSLFLVAGSYGQRAALRITYAGALTVLLIYGGLEARARHDEAFGPAHPQSSLTAQPFDAVEWIWSGGVTPTSAVVVARLTKPAAEARLLIDQNVSFGNPIASAAVAPDGDGVVKLHVDGLQPDMLYHYSVEVDGNVDRQRRGSLRTFPDGAASFSIAVGSCARTGSNGAVFDALLQEDVLFYLMTGDAHYENITRNDLRRFQEAYQTLLTAPAQAALFRQTPIAYVWDDHDFGGNNSAGSSDAKEAARFSYRQNVPHYEQVAGSGNAPIYQAFTAGRVRFILLDTRSMRDEEKMADGSKSMLGRKQREWLKQEFLAASRAHGLIVLVSSVPWIAPESNGRDDWGGYASERREIADFIADNDIRDLLVLAGDAHMLAIDDGSNTDYSTSGGAGFPILHAAALDRRGSEKGGPYSEGAFPGVGQYGLVTFTDEGDSIEVELRGRNWQGEDIVSYTFATAR